MTLRLIATTAFALCAAGTAAHAQLAYSGEVRLGYYNQTFDDARFGFLDAEVEYTFGASGFGVGLDVFASVDLEDDVDDLNYVNLYGVYNASFGRFEFGHTASAAELVMPLDRVGTSELFELQVRAFADPIFASYLFDSTVYGVNYYGDYDEAQVAAAIHYLDDADAYVYSAAMRTQFGGGYYLSSGIDLLSDMGTGQAPVYRLGGGYEMVQLSIDALYTRNFTFAEDTGLTEVDVAYDIQQVAGLTVGANYTAIDFGSSTNDIFGLGAEYTHETGFGLAANASFPEGGDNQYAVEVLFDF